MAKKSITSGPGVKQPIRGRRSRGRALPAPMPGAVQKEALALLQGLRKPGGRAYATARTFLREFALSTDTAAPSLRDHLRFLVSCWLGKSTLKGYCTLDSEQIRDINKVLESIRTYASNPARKRPLNLLMLAAPGAGKSHLVRCIADELGTQKMGALTYNMVGLQRHEDLIPALDAARNLKVADRLPLLFLDEFDVEPDNYPLLLPLLWDGQLTVGQHDLKLGKVVIVLAGSHKDLPVTMDAARSMKPAVAAPEGSHPKLVDLLSRINGGVLRIPPLDSEVGHPRYADKICIAVDLLRQRFGKKLQRVPVALLRFIARVNFRYGVRSLAQLVDAVEFGDDQSKLTLSTVRLPLGTERELKDSSLAYHLVNDQQGHGITKLWQECTATKAVILVASDTIDYLASRMKDRPKWFLSDYMVPRLWEELQNRVGGQVE